VTEAELQSGVIDCARLFGWRVAHFRAALTKHGWRTPVQADGAGFPDLVLVRGGRLLFVELKGDGGRVTDEQRRWLEEFGRVAVLADAVEVHTWRPDDWTTGRIDNALARAPKEAAA
jgi:hypothetical protein